MPRSSLFVAVPLLLVLRVTAQRTLLDVLPKTPMAVREAPSIEPRCADVNGDGNLDILVPGWGPFEMYVSDGRGGFADQSQNAPAVSGFVFMVETGDVDGDRDVDVVIATSFQRNYVFVNDGRGKFTMSRGLPRTSTDDTAVVLLDVDSDGDLDAFFGGLKANTLYLNNGSGSFSASATLPSHADETYALDFADVDGDKDLDVVVGNFGRNRLYVNDGKGRFTDATSNVPFDTQRTKSLVFGDVDGDGDADLLEGNLYSKSGGNRLYLNDGKGKFTLANQNLPAHKQHTFDVVLADVDLDADLDAVICNSLTWSNDFDSQNRLYLNDGKGKFVDATATHLPAAHFNCYGVAAADLNKDLFPDLVVTCRNQRTRLHINDRRGRFVGATDGGFPVLTGNTRAVAHADFDGDGTVDVVAANWQDPSRIYLNDGVGGFSVVELNNPNDANSDVAAADVDGDGDVDVLFGVGGQNRLFLNDGKGKFTDVTRTRLPLGVTNTHAVAFGDLDGDGDVDAFVGNYGRNEIYTNDGRGRFTRAVSSALPSHSDQTTSVALADVDNDGDLDALIGTRQRINRLYLNTRGRFTDAPRNLPATVLDTMSVAFGDLNGDGYVDAYIGNRGSQNRLYLNDRSGRLVDATRNLPADRDWTFRIGMADLDEDGDLDLVLANGGTFHGTNRVLLNDGKAVFTTSRTLMRPDRDHTEGVAIADFDGDGDLDALFANSEIGQSFHIHNRLFRNRTRHLHSKRIALRTQDYVLEVNNRPGASAAGELCMIFLGFNKLAAPIRIPGFRGSLQIDIALSAATSPTAIPAPQGLLELTVRLPNDPTLLGKTIYSQAIVADPRSTARTGFTNRTADRVVW